MELSILMTSSTKRNKKVQLWKVSFQSKKYSGEYEDVTVHAPNPKCAIDRASKLTWVIGGIKSVESVQLLGVSEN